MMATGQQLQQAYELIKGGHKEHAASLLAVMLVADPCNADAWWLLALAAPSAELMQRALSKLLELRPDDVRARQLLDSASVRQLLANARAASFQRQAVALPAYPPAGMEPRLPNLRSRQRPARHSSRPVSCTVALMMAGLFGVFGCALLAFAVISGFQWVGRALEGFNPLPSVQIGQAAAEDQPDLGDINMLGNTGYMQLRSAVFGGPGERHLYTFAGRSGDWVALDATTPESALDVALALYADSGMLVGGNTDRSSDDPDAALGLALPQTGAYTIVVSAQAGQGAYSLQLRH